MLQNLGGAHLIVIVFIVLLLFGAPKLPGLAKSLGQSLKILKKEVASEGRAADAQSAEGAEGAQSGQDQPGPTPTAQDRANN